MGQVDSSRYGRFFSQLSLTLVLMQLPACGNKTFPVQGMVVFENGTPAHELAGYLIMFQSQEHQMSANGIIQADGSFSVGTFQDNDGALQGKHRIAITPPPPEFDKPRPPARIPSRYGSFDSSKLEVDIKSETNQFTIKVERIRSP